MNVVLDTNVIVSAVIRPSSNPSRLLDLALRGAYSLCTSTQLVSEYRSVLLRPKLRLNTEDVLQLIDAIEAVSTQRVPPPQASAISPDPKDQMVLDLAVETQALLVTDNLRHFESYPRAVSPTDALRKLAEHS